MGVLDLAKADNKQQQVFFIVGGAAAAAVSLLLLFLQKLAFKKKVRRGVYVSVCQSVLA